MQVPAGGQASVADVDEHHAEPTAIEVYLEESPAEDVKSAQEREALPQPVGATIESADAGPGVVMAFRRPDGVSVEQTFTRQPIGFYLNRNEMPLAVKKVLPGTQAGEQGVQLDWRLASVNGASVEMSEYTEAMQILRAATSTLPGSQRRK